MAHDSKFEITARTIDFGTRIVAVSQIVATGFTRGRPFFAPGLVLIVAALAVGAYDLVLGQGSVALRSGGSTIIWLALIVLGVGIFALVYQHRTLTVALSDGGKIRLSAAHDDFLRSVVARFGEAMRAEAGSALHYRIDMKAETVEILADAGPQTPRNDVIATTELQAFERQAGALNGGAGAPPDWTRGPYAVQHSVPINGAAPHSGNGFDRRNGAAPWPNDAAVGEALQARHPTAGPSFAMTAGGATPVAAASAGALGRGQAPGPGSAQARATQSLPSNPKRELDALVALILRSDIQHKSALLDLLTVVDDHLKNGGTSRADAVAHWQSFSSYAEQYLAAVDGLMPLTKRVGRNFAHA